MAFFGGNVQSCVLISGDSVNVGTTVQQQFDGIGVTGARCNMQRRLAVLQYINISISIS